MKLLIVDDELNLAQALKSILLSEGFEVDIAYDGAEGHNMAQANHYDLILLDINLPVMDGIEVCTRLRHEGKDTPIIMLTAKETTSDKVLGLDAGADDYLPKPFETSELLARIRALTRRITHQVTLLEIDNLKIDSQSQTVSREGVRIELSAKEYALLNYLGNRADSLVPKQELMEAVWPDKKGEDSNLVDVYIGYVRKKIDKAFPKSQPLLFTIKGRGYRLGRGRE